MGMDWHSSGITTSVIGALKRGLAPLEGELGIHVCGGRGKHSRQTPHELIAIGERVGFDGGALAQASRLVAKVDSAAVQDGFDLYLHGFIVTDDGKWVVVQQGMNGERKQARRYHWLSEGLNSFVDEPHAAIEGAGRARSSISPTAARKRRAPRRSSSSHRSGRTASRASYRALERSRQEAGSPQPAQPTAAAPDHAGSTTKCDPSDVIARRLHGNLRRRRTRPGGFPRTAAHARRRRAHGARAGDGGRSRARRAVPLQPIRRASRSRTAARTDTRSRCRSGSTTRPSAC